LEPAGWRLVIRKSEKPVGISFGEQIQRGPSLFVSGPKNGRSNKEDGNYNQPFFLNRIQTAKNECIGEI
jgi:hypothetical protein